MRPQSLRFWLSLGAVLALSVVAKAQQAGVGVPPFRPIPDARIRASIAIGVNAGHASDAPLAVAGLATYDLGTVILGGSIVTSSNNSFQPPRNTLTEGDLLVGIGSDQVIARYEATPRTFYAAVESGVGIVDLSQRWRFGRRGFFDTTGYRSRPTTDQVSLAIPLQAQLYFEPFRFAGIGVATFMSISKLRPSYGAALSLQARM